MPVHGGGVYDMAPMHEVQGHVWHASPRGYGASLPLQGTALLAMSEHAHYTAQTPLMLPLPLSLYLLPPPLPCLPLACPYIP